jgi:hypothetical protein
MIQAYATKEAVAVAEPPSSTPKLIRRERAGGLGVRWKGGLHTVARTFLMAMRFSCSLLNEGVLRMCLPGGSGTRTAGEPAGIG